MTAPRRFLTDEGHARPNAIFAAILFGLAVVLVIVIVTHTFGRAAL